MIRPAFIVDGFTEKGIVEKLCPGKPVRRTDCNGKDVTISAIAEKIASIIRLLGNRYYPIVILVDKEERRITYRKMAEELKAELVKQGITNQDLRIGVADWNIENWIIADWETLSGITAAKPLVTDGCDAKKQIIRLKGSYKKPIDGVELFVAARQSIIYQNSPSYRHFIDHLKDLECRYLSSNSKTVSNMR